MINTEEILKKIERLYQHHRTNEATDDIPLRLQVKRFAHFAREYITAASILEREVPHYFLAILQLTGHALELSLKACLASANSIPRSEHDLIKLYLQAEKLGFELDAREFAAIVHLQHFYFKDLATGTKYKVRYPVKKSEPLGGAVPNNSTFTSIVNALLDQATQRGAI